MIRRAHLIKTLFCFIISGWICYPLHSQDTTAMMLSGQIEPENLKIHVFILSADSLEGRATGTSGQKKAASYIEGFFESLGLNAPVKGESPAYRQSFVIEMKTTVSGEITAGNKKFSYPDEFVTMPDGALQSEAISMDVIFAGYGDSLDYRDLDVKNKSVMIFFEGDSRERRKRIRIGQNFGARNFIFLFSDNKGSFTGWVSGFKYFLEQPVVQLSSDPEPFRKTHVLYMAPETGAEVIGIKLQKLKALVDKNKRSPKNSYRKIKPARIDFNLIVSSNEVITENIAGIVPGTEFPGEVVVVSAHYDHIGKVDTLIYHGADDNASGTAAIMELARVFSKAKSLGLGPKRTVLFLAFTGEEKGLMGSEYYSSNPLFPLDRTVADFNIDMIGRIDQKHEGNPRYVYLIGSDKISKELHSISEECNKIYSGLELDYTYNDENDPQRFYYRSDHYNFAKNNIPVIFYFTGVHKDYHTPADTADKIDYDKMAAIVKLIFHTVWEVSNSEDRLEKD